VESGYDYVGFEMSGESISYFQNVTLEAIERRVKAKQNASADNFLAATRLVVSPSPVEDKKELATVNLVMALESGDAFCWKGGSTNFSSVITVDKKQRSLKVSAVVQDLLQDLMVANSDSLQAVIRKIKIHLTTKELKERADEAAKPGEMPANPSDEEIEAKVDKIGERLFLQSKANFARSSAASSGRQSLFSSYEPDRYAAFSSLARSDLYATMDANGPRDFGDLWTRFLVEYYADHFLTADEAVRLVRTGAFRRTRADGQKVKARVRWRWLADSDLHAIINDKRVVTTSGCYVLCILNKITNGDHGDLSSLFQLSSLGVIRRLTLCTEERYAKMVPLVRKGLVTPIRLFLKKA